HGARAGANAENRRVHGGSRAHSLHGGLETSSARVDRTGAGHSAPALEGDDSILRAPGGPGNPVRLSPDGAGLSRPARCLQHRARRVDGRAAVLGVPLERELPPAVAPRSPPPPIGVLPGSETDAVISLTLRVRGRRSRERVAPPASAPAPVA